MTKRAPSLAMATLAGVLLLLSGCGPDLSTPEAALNRWCEARQANDIGALLKCMAEDEREETRKQLEADAKKLEGKAPREYVVTPKGIEKDGEWTIGKFELWREGYKSADSKKLILIQKGGNWYVSMKAGEEYRAAQLGLTVEEMKAMQQEWKDLMSANSDRGPLD